MFQVFQVQNYSVLAIFFPLQKKWSFLRIWSHFLKKSLMENFIFCAIFPSNYCEILFSFSQKGMLILASHSEILLVHVQSIFEIFNKLPLGRAFNLHIIFSNIFFKCICSNSLRKICQNTGFLWPVFNV